MGKAKGRQKLSEGTSASQPVRRIIGLAVLLLAVGAVVLATYWPVLSAQALFLDDQQYVVANHLVQNPSWDSAGRFFGEVLEPSTVGGYYQPLAMVSLMLDWAMGARTDDLRGFHRTSLVLHVLNAMLVAVFLYVVFGRAWAAALVGVLFGIHPMTVEPVAWLSDRKTLLTMFFVLWCLILYVFWTRKHGWGLYGAALGMFVLALLSKPTSTLLPVLLLLLDCWPMGRLSVRAVVEKVPFFVVAGVAGIVTFISQARSAVVVMPHDDSLLRIPLTVCHNLVFYPYKIIWPAKLTPYNPFPDPFDLSQPMVLAGVIGTVLLIAVLLISLRWTRALMVGWLFFFVAIFPTLGIIGFADVIAADKYVYLPAIGLLMILAHFLGRLWEWPSGASRLTVRVVSIVVVVTVVALGMARTRRQLGYWRDTESLYQYMLTFTPEADIVHSDLGDELKRQGRFDEAVEHYAHALRTNPNSYDAHNGLGRVLVDQGKFEQAARHFEAAVGLNPERGGAYNGLGMSLARRSKFDEAFGYFEKALQLEPNRAEIHSNMAAVLVRRGEFDRAIEHYAEALRLRPEYAGGHYNWGIALLRMGQPDRAAEHFREAIRLQADYLGAYHNLALVLISRGKIDEAIGVYEDALRVAPNDAKLRAALEQAKARRAARRGHQP